MFYEDFQRAVEDQGVGVWVVWHESVKQECNMLGFLFLIVDMARMELDGRL